MFASCQFVERGLCDINVASLNELRHLSEKERQQQRADVRTIDVCVSHDDDAVVAQLIRIKFVLADAAAQGGDQSAYLRRAEHLVETRLFDV